MTKTFGVTLVFTAFLIVAGTSRSSEGGLITFTETTIGSGSLGGTAFSNKSITFTSIADTSSIVNGFQNIITNLSTTVAIDGFGIATILTPTQTKSQNFAGIAGIFQLYDVPGNQLIQSATSDVFKTYDLASALGPITVAQVSNNGFNNLSTSLGALSITLSATSTPPPRDRHGHPLRVGGPRTGLADHDRDDRPRRARVLVEEAARDDRRLNPTGQRWGRRPRPGHPVGAPLSPSRSPAIRGFGDGLHVPIEIARENPDHASTSSAEDEKADGPSMSEDIDESAPGSTALPRRAILKGLAALGVGSATFHRTLAARAAQAGSITPEMIQQAEWIAGLELTEAERNETASSIRRSLSSFEALRKVEVGYDVPPSLAFVPSPGLRQAEGVRRNQASPGESHAPKRPDSDEGLAFLPVTELSSLIRSGQVSSTELTKLYLARLKRFDPLLKCVVTLTEDLALKQAAKADLEISSGIYRGPLHGIPWGAKDLIAYPGYPTTWGALPFKDRVIDEKATVAARLEEAGAVMLGKLSLGALAMGDRWQGGMTRSPWDPRRGSSGSSAGSASTVAAGLVGFAIGSETLGSIVSPCRACGASGLRPTFGRVSRHGCMSLSWSMDKLGPIARSLEDCALVLDAIHGADGLDASAVDQPFAWPPRVPVRGLKVGYFRRDDQPEADRDELKILKDLGVELVPIKLPAEYPVDAITLMLSTEAAAAFDDLTRKHISEGLNTWPATFRERQFVPAVEYLRASRVRTLLMRSMARLMTTVDLYVGGNDLSITNLTGHPTAVLPHGFRDDNGRERPGSITFTGQLYGESTLLAVAAAFQQAAGHHLKRPPLERYLAEEAEREKKEKEAQEKAPG